MLDSFQEKHVLVIDRQDYWRHISSDALKQAGALVDAQDHYDLSLVEDISPDLVVLGCAFIGPEEKEFIHKILQHRFHLVVFCGVLRGEDMRALFLEGADDVTSKTYDPENLITVVKDTFGALAARSSYQTFEG